MNLSSSPWTAERRQAAIDRMYVCGTCYSMCAYNLIYNLKYSLDLYNNIVTNCAHFVLCSVVLIVSSELLSLALFELSLFGSCLHCYFFLACIRNIILYVHVNHLYPFV